jgi:hypothetical protein
VGETTKDTAGEIDFTDEKTLDRIYEWVWKHVHARLYCDIADRMSVDNTPDAINEHVKRLIAQKRYRHRVSAFCETVEYYVVVEQEHGYTEYTVRARVSTEEFGQYQEASVAFGLGELARFSDAARLIIIEQVADAVYQLWLTAEEA